MKSESGVMNGALMDGNGSMCLLIPFPCPFCCPVAVVVTDDENEAQRTQSRQSAIDVCLCGTCGACMFFLFILFMVVIFVACLAMLTGNPSYPRSSVI